MPVLPLIDLMIVVGWTSLFAGFVLKAIYITTHYRPLLIGLSPIDFLLIAVVCLLFSLALAARTWVKAHEPGLQLSRRGPVNPYDGSLMRAQAERYAAGGTDGVAYGTAMETRGVGVREAGGISPAAASASEAESMDQRSGRSSAKAEVASSA